MLMASRWSKGWCGTEQLWHHQLWLSQSVDDKTEGNFYSDCVRCHGVLVIALGTTQTMAAADNAEDALYFNRMKHSNTCGMDTGGS